MGLRDIVATRAIEQGGKLTVRSALNPLLWLCAIVTVPTLFLLYKLESAPAWAIVLAFLPVVSTIIGYAVLLVKDRDKLQSEDYQIKKLSLELIEEKGDLRPSIAEEIRTAISKPDLPQLSQGDHL